MASGGCLENTDLESADLENADLEKTDLENTDLDLGHVKARLHNRFLSPQLNFCRAEKKKKKSKQLSLGK